MAAIRITDYRVHEIEIDRMIKSIHLHLIAIGIIVSFERPHSMWSVYVGCACAAISVRSFNAIRGLFLFSFSENI